MGIFDFFRKNKSYPTISQYNTKNNTNTHIINQTASHQQIQPTTIKSAFKENHYVRVDDRANRYTLIEGEDIITDGGRAEAYELTLSNRITCYDEKICPNCGSVLETVPKRKKKCPLCGEYIHVINSYIQKDKIMLLTPEEYSILKSYKDMFFDLKYKSKELSNSGISKEIYLANNNFSSINDAIWYLYNKKSIIEFNALNIGIHRNIIFSMAKILMEEYKYEEALNQLYYIVYLDINGCCNNRRSLEESFDTSNSFIAPGIIEKISICLSHINKNIEDTKHNFLEIKNRNLPTPISVDDAWKKLLNEYINEN